MPASATNTITVNTPLRLGLISNPKSGRNRQNPQGIKQILGHYPEVHFREATTPSEVAAAVDELASQAINVLAINGGDGTVASVLTTLFNQRPFSRQPMLALLRGGTTNMTAGDVGLKGDNHQSLRKLLARLCVAPSDIPIVEREVLQVHAAPNQSPTYGMFFGTGAIINGIEYCHDKVLSKGIQSGVGPGLCTLRMLFALIRGDTQTVEPVSIAVNMEPQVSIAVNMEPQVNSTIQTQPLDHFLLLASTLERLFLGIRPYWGAGTGALYYTVIYAPPIHPLRALPSLFWGRPNRYSTPQNGYLSHKVNSLRLRMNSKYTVDGELYEAHSDLGAVHVKRGGKIQFIQL